eukprot:COSAG02_NODE_27041_length_618_cov_1.057803_1_plen_68_part_00
MLRRMGMLAVLGVLAVAPMVRSAPPILLYSCTEGDTLVCVIPKVYCNVYNAPYTGTIHPPSLNTRSK